MRVGGSVGARYAVMPTTPLALGQTDLLTDQYKVQAYDKASFVFEDPLHNPWHLLDGHSDIAFVIVYLLPLFIIALAYDLLAAEREDGTLRLLMATSISLMTLVGGKMIVRGGIILLLAVLLPAVHHRAGAYRAVGIRATRARVYAICSLPASVGIRA